MVHVHVHQWLMNEYQLMEHWWVDWWYHGSVAWFSAMICLSAEAPW